MIIEHDRNGKEVARYERFTPEKIKEFYNLVGKDNTNSFLDRLNMHGEAYLRPDDPYDDGVLFIEKLEEE